MIGRLALKRVWVSCTPYGTQRARVSASNYQLDL
jgi:hypothetical protein